MGMTKEDQQAMENILTLVDNAVKPANMTLSQAAEFLEDLMGSIQARLDGINDDLRGRG